MTPQNDPESSSVGIPDRTWKAVDTLGRELDRRLESGGVRLTMGGEPTYLPRGAPVDPQWSTEALGEAKRQLAARLLLRLQERFAPGSLLHYGLGKWYPGEDQPRWAFGCYWRRDGVPLWRRQDLLFRTGWNGITGAAEVEAFMHRLTRRLKIPGRCLLEVKKTSNGPGGGGFVLPLLRVGGNGGPRWVSCRWRLAEVPLRPIPGDAPLGLRLPLNELARVKDENLAREYDPDAAIAGPAEVTGGLAADNSIRVALCAELRDGVLNLFLPPMGRAANYLDLLSELEITAAERGQVLRIEGEPPPADPLLVFFQITPDPGVLEINTHPAGDWPGMVAIAETLDQEARACGLWPTKHLRDGRPVGSGGGHHLTLGAAVPEQSPFFRRPDLLRSLITYWQNHPGLSYGFAGLFVGPTCQAPRIDESRQDSLPELELAFAKIRPFQPLDPLTLGRMMQHLLVDATGNGHRAEFCLDKLWPPLNPRGRLGLLELRGFAMQSHPRLELVLALLVRALVVRFWEQPYRGALVRWGSALHDRFALPEFIAADLAAVAAELQEAGIPFQTAWLQSHLEFRFPVCGRLEVRGEQGLVALELRIALEPWPVLGEAAAGGAPSRPVDSSCERLQVAVNADITGRYAVLCNGRRVPLVGVGAGRSVGGIRFKAWPLENGLHPEIAPHAPLLLELVEVESGRCLGACRYHVGPPEGGDYADFPLDEKQARRRRKERFGLLPGRPGPVPLPPLQTRAEAPLTLDLRYQDEDPD